MQQVKDSVKEFQICVVGDIVAGVEQTISDRGGLSRGMLESIITTTIERTGISTLAAALQKPRDSDGDDQIQDADADSRILLYEWRGRYRRFPEDYKLSDGNPR